MKHYHPILFYVPQAHRRFSMGAHDKALSSLGGKGPETYTPKQMFHGLQSLSSVDDMMRHSQHGQKEDE